MRNLPTTLAIVTLAMAASTCGGGSGKEPTPALKPCTVGEGVAAECGSVPVFENRDSRRGRKIDIAFAVLRATGGPARDAVFLFAGGPGQASTALASSAAGWLQPLRATLDIVMVDQRGTGQSHRLGCDSGIADTPAKAFGHVFDPAWVNRCRATLEQDADLTQYTTRRAIDDIDDVRARLGYRQISIYGASYGTRLGLAYAQKFPDRIRSMVLDAVLAPDARGPLSFAATAAGALDRVIASCRQHPLCDRAYPDLASDFVRLLARFDAGTVQAPIRTGATPVVVEMTRGDLGYALRGMLYEPRAVFELPAHIARGAATGDVTPFAQAYAERASRLHRTLAHGMHLSVQCSEDVARIRDEEIDPATAGTFLGRYVVDEYRRACAGWPVAPVETVAPPGGTLRAPVLPVSGYFDPVTPPAMAAGVAAFLPLARHIIAPAGAHGSAAGCPRAAVLHLLIRATFDGMPGGCE